VATADNASEFYSLMYSHEKRERWMFLQLYITRCLGVISVRWSYFLSVAVPMRCRVLIYHIYRWRFACITIPCFMNRAMFLKRITCFTLINYSCSFSTLARLRAGRQESDYDYWRDQNGFFFISFDLALDTSSYLLNGSWEFLSPHPAPPTPQ